MAQPLRVLLVEDNPPDADLVLMELRRAGFDPEWQRVCNERGFLDGLNHHSQCSSRFRNPPSSRVGI